MQRARIAIAAFFCAFVLALSAPSVASAAPTTTTTTVQMQPGRRLYSSVRAVPRPSEDGRILDKAGYNLERSYALTSAIRDFESRINAPVYVVTLPSIGRPKSGVKDFATRLFNAWEIGRGGTQKGVLVLIVRDVRRVEVEVGKTLNGVVSHSWTTRMLANEVLPTLREGEYARGLEKAVERLAARIENNGGNGLPNDWYRSPSFWMAPGKTMEADDALRALGYGGGGSVLAMGYAVGAAKASRRGRTCDTCGSVVKQGEVVLGGGCGDDDYVQKILTELNPWLNGTISSNRNNDVTYKRVGRWRTVREATYEQQGLRERTLRCHKCGEVSRKVQIIPRLVETSSSSDADGGGCSDGGGGGGGDF